MAWEVWRFEDLEEKDDLIDEWMNESETEVFVEHPGYTGSDTNTNWSLVQ